MLGSARKPPRHDIMGEDTSFGRQTSGSALLPFTDSSSSENPLAARRLNTVDATRSFQEPSSSAPLSRFQRSSSSPALFSRVEAEFPSSSSSLEMGSFGGLEPTLEEAELSPNEVGLAPPSNTGYVRQVSASRSPWLPFPISASPSSWRRPEWGLPMRCCRSPRIPKILARSQRRRLLVPLILIAFLGLVVVAVRFTPPWQPATAPPDTGAGRTNYLPVGVNLGGWLNLEDWFFSGHAAPNPHVSTNGNLGQGQCLPPLVPAVGSKPWSSEGTLVYRLNRTVGPLKTAQALQAHRESFVKQHEDLRKIVELGIKKLRVPVNWALFADALAQLDPLVYGAHDPEEELAVVPDVHYAYEETGVEPAAFVTVPRRWFKSFLENCAAAGVSVILDMHAFPGGSSDGTYNGVWPNVPRFWLNRTRVPRNPLVPGIPIKETGLWVVRALINWVEKLEGPARSAVQGLTLMNEPAHLSTMAKKAGKPWVEEQEVLDWLRSAADLFRNSSLPAPEGGVRLYMNLIETAFEDFSKAIPKWWRETFTAEERKTWAVIDIHRYTAWSGGTCDGRLLPGGGYVCGDPLDQIRSTLRACAESFTRDFQDMFPDPDLRATTEFSGGSFENGALACRDPDVVKVLLEEQRRAFLSGKIEAFFWTWRMPEGPKFEAGWSLKQIAGLEEVSPPGGCGGSGVTGGGGDNMTFIDAPALYVGRWSPKKI